ncbi:ubiquitin carboxyl-terminal hydrolase 1 [Protopterus annectens]|uniref:ubiquitin carboxyl-terminal hydrolase 1 n=1 Tax=Protopterus annectens TaxID=7888 RepID=UPI001CFAB3F4|nr:ubiquitin carboxyl-terminal hydrolase 1 [Protopterus annectens]
MPGLVQSDCSGLIKGSPLKRNRLSLKFLQKKETKRALDFTVTQNGEGTSEPRGSESSNLNRFTDIVKKYWPTLTSSTEIRKIVGDHTGFSFKNERSLRNLCYQDDKRVDDVLYYCPGFRTGVKHLYDIVSNKREKAKLDGEAKYEKLRELNPMYEGYLQHDAQEVLQCILGYIQEACQMLKKEEMKSTAVNPSVVIGNTPVVSDDQQVRENSPFESGVNCIKRESETDSVELPFEEDAKKGVSGKRKSESDGGNNKKKTKIVREQQVFEEEKRTTRSKRKSIDVMESQEEPNKRKGENDATAPAEKKTRLRLSCFKLSTKQPSILSKFSSMGKLTTNLGGKNNLKDNDQCDNDLNSPKHNESNSEGKKSSFAPDDALSKKDAHSEHAKMCIVDEDKASKDISGLDLMEQLFQGQLLLRTRCLECECFTERREDFQDISVPVQEDDPPHEDDNSEISPEPKSEKKTLKWAISQFASVERIVGQDKYFCENCRHYTEAERSLLFDKMPEVVTIHLKCFAANNSEFDCYGGLSKVNTPLLTPLKLSLKEWSSKSIDDHYELFAVVMHNGITISSGHYTAYVKTADLNNLEISELLAQDLVKSESLNEQEVRPDYTDGCNNSDVFKLGGNSQSSVAKASSKKIAEGTGLLGGQKNKSDFEVCSTRIIGHESSTDNTAKGGNSDVRDIGNSAVISKTDEEPSSKEISSSRSSDNACTFINLKEYEGKWILFDDSEVKATEEKEFLSSLSPDTSSTSTPYLLFYKKVSAYQV